MGAAKKIILRIAVLIIILVVCNLFYKYLFWQEDLNALGGEQLIELKNAQDSADVIYFGESSNWTPSEDDTTKKHISQFTIDHFPSLLLRDIQKGGFHAGVFLPLINQIDENRRVKTIIVTMNLRSFGAAWIHSKLETSLSRYKILYKRKPPLLNRSLIAFGAYDNKTDAEREDDMIKQWESDVLKLPAPFKYTNVKQWDSAMANGSYLNADGSWDIPKIQLACAYIKAYAFQIDVNTNPRIKDFDEIVDLCKQKNLNLLFNLLPENVEYADSLVGKDLVFLMRQNAQLLEKRYNKDGVVVVNNLELVDGKDYIDQNWTTEHYKQKGREAIARQLATAIKKGFNL